MNWYLEALKKYAVFGGRARRREYWYFFLFNVIISFVLSSIDYLTGNFNWDYAIGPLSGLYSLAVIVPGLSVTVRRLHDTSRSGWWCFIAFVPIVGAIVLLVFLVQDSTPGENQHGPSPKVAAA